MLQYKNIKYIFYALLVPIGLAALFMVFHGSTYAQATPAGCPGGPPGPPAPGIDCEDQSTWSGNNSDDCIEIGVGVPGVEDNCVENGEGDNNPIFVYLRGIIQFLAVGVGVAVAIGIVVAGIQFMASRGNPQATAAAIQRLWNAIIALVLFIFMAAIINFLIPGGLL